MFWENVKMTTEKGTSETMVYTFCTQSHRTPWITLKFGNNSFAAEIFGDQRPEIREKRNFPWPASFIHCSLLFITLEDTNFLLCVDRRQYVTNYDVKFDAQDSTSRERSNSRLVRRSLPFVNAAPRIIRRFHARRLSPTSRACFYI